MKPLAELFAITYLYEPNATSELSTLRSSKRSAINPSDCGAIGDSKAVAHTANLRAAAASANCAAGDLEEDPGTRPEPTDPRMGTTREEVPGGADGAT